MKRLRDLSNGQWLAFLAVVLFAAVLRLWWNDVESYSPADESVYAGYAQTLAQHGFVQGYPEITASYLGDARMGRYPSPLRWGYLALATAAVHVYGSSDPHALAWLSTLCGIFVVPLVFVLGLRWFGFRVALLAAAFTAVSCIELALGRRALQDEVFCLAVLLALTLFLAALERQTLSLTIAAVAAMTFAFAVKETFTLLYPAFLAVLFVYYKPRQLRVRHALMIGLPPLLFFAGFSLLARSGRAFLDIGRMITSAMQAPYVQQYQAGPPHRLLFDLFVTAPLVSILAAAAAGVVMLSKNSGREERALILFLVLALAVFAIPSSKNLRFTMIVDPFVRLAAAWILAAPPAGLRAFRTAGLTAFAAANAAIELELFRTIFVRGAVYDPVTHSLLEALSAVPRVHAEPAPHVIFPILCAVIAAASWVWSRARPSRG